MTMGSTLLVIVCTFVSSLPSLARALSLNHANRNESHSLAGTLLLWYAHDPTLAMCERFNADCHEVQRNTPKTQCMVVVDTTEQTVESQASMRRRMGRTLDGFLIHLQNSTDLERRYPHLLFSDDPLVDPDGKQVHRSCLGAKYFHMEPLFPAIESLEAHGIKLADNAHVWIIEQDVAFCPSLSKFIEFNTGPKSRLDHTDVVTGMRIVPVRNPSRFSQIKHENPTLGFRKRYPSDQWWRYGEQMLRFSKRFMDFLGGLLDEGISAESEMLVPTIVHNERDELGEMRFKIAKFRLETVFDAFEYGSTVNETFLKDLCSQTLGVKLLNQSVRDRFAKWERLGKQYYNQTNSMYHKVKFASVHRSNEGNTF